VARRLDLERHVGEHELDGLELGDRLAELLRSIAYFTAASKAPWAMPSDIAPIEMRPPASVDRNCL
jgi:hypothetical protein